MILSVIKAALIILFSPAVQASHQGLLALKQPKKVIPNKSKKLNKVAIAGLTRRTIRKIFHSEAPQLSPLPKVLMEPAINYA